ncbi:DUF2953 domain-containing protein [Methanobacterium alcaliphilum]|uniref:DUF2953 domain-containing protein n=1 Tax=Methanobacterium alcaliphilum TaxID=392018 RepID=UPI00200A7415|nr:DUF2953 domain-containing protein [Methanobacterium alcaliphilum]MCK9151508.1 DUF2953 domain-containing protein [Methanobacterium alcaliphilum]
MIIITTVLIIFFLICILILLVPFHISLKLQIVGGATNGIFELYWFKIRILSKVFPEKKAKKDKKKEIKDEKKDGNGKRKWEWKDIKKIINLGFKAFKPLIRFVRDILHSIHLEKFKIHIILGLNSPVDTATTLGYFWAAASLVNMIPKINISAEPSFNQERVDGNLLLKLNIRLINPLIAVLRLLTNRSILKLLWELRRFRK